MGKLHRINTEYFRMDENGEIFCQFGMSIICRVKTGWGQEGDPVQFYYRDQKLVGPETRVGDVVFMEHDGPRTSWVLGKKPRDPRLALLWEFGFRSSTRVNVEDHSVDSVVHELRIHAGFEYADDPDPTDWAWREPLPCGSKKPSIVKDNSGSVMVALYHGRVCGRDTGYCQWFMAENASLTDIKSALIADSSLNKEHPLLQ